MKKLTTTLLMLILINFLVCAQWKQTNGIYGGYINAFYIAGDSIYVGTNGGVYLSTNNGNTWQQKNIGLLTKMVTSIIKHEGTMYAGTWGGGVSVSKDNGNHWQASGLNYSSILALAAGKTNIYASLAGGGISLSTDSGKNWTSINNGLTSTYVACLALQGENIFAGTIGSGLFLSTDSGKTWTAKSPELLGSDIKSMAISGSKIIVSTTMGLFLSTDNGDHWSSIYNGLLNSSAYSIVIDGNNIFIGTIPGAVFKSVDNGKSWTKISAGLDNYTIVSLAVKDGNIFAGSTGGGVLVSSDYGNHWKGMNSGLLSSGCDVVSAKKNIYAGTWGNGIYTLKPNGWELLDSTLIKENTQTIYPVDSTDLLVGTEHGLFRSVKKDNKWTTESCGLKNKRIWTLAYIDSKIIAGLQEGVFISSDNGKTWESPEVSPTCQFIYKLAKKDNRLFAGTDSGVFISDNKGISWELSNKGLTNKGILALLVYENDIYAGTRNGLFRSSDNGANWLPIYPGLGPLIIAIIVKGNCILIDTYHQGMQLSVNNGNNWTPVNTGMENVLGYSICMNDTAIFSGTESNSVFSRPYRDFAPHLTEISGTPVVCKGDKNINYSVPADILAYAYSWTLPDGAIGTSTSNSIYVNFDTTAVSGVIKVKAYNDFAESTELELPITVKSCLTSVDDQDLHSKIIIYPNPTSDLITIDGNISDKNNLKIEVLNYLGHKIPITLIKEKNLIQIDLTTYPKGVYLIKLSSSSKSQIYKVVKQ